MFRCASYCIGSGCDLFAFSEVFTSIETPVRVCSSDAIHVTNSSKTQKEIFVFSYGCVIFWNYSEEEEALFLKNLIEYVDAPLENYLSDLCYYVVLEDGPTNIDMASDVIQISKKNDDNPYTKLALSYGLSQSVKLRVFEISVFSLIEENKKIPLELVKRGYIKVPRRELAKKIGMLFMERSAINLSNDVLDIPGFFWKNPKYENVYDASRKFMDIQQRSDNLNRRLAIIYELYEILRDEVNHSHSLRLEMIIIFLIFVEMVLSMVEIISKFF
ncbi:Putative conserved hypothetical protein [Candidatus Fokinia solitaria]|uniref:DUF155 domain-containing protein n=1 Tax=Candidatus Fokinia solitaria TaxID=1802984 RepID=A0A2U8BSX3_9RICK|nr:RMD1 family protein [Candidatus Fokinia solitaria]AWD33423.1 Putative conserved hypothetical protein [Candidatus Fokinia solitaria]